jgi:Mn2+/Fe2+ NRAMP family transporter
LSHSTKKEKYTDKGLIMAEKTYTEFKKEHNQKQMRAQKKQRRNAMIGAAFLMATSAVGPGFLTQTAVFTEVLLGSFGFVILITTILNVGAQMNIWRIIAITKMRGQDIANSVFPGLGYVVAAFITLGGLVFNIGNVAGGGLGLNALLGISDMTGAIITGIICIFIFLSKEAGAAMDQIVKILGAGMIILTGYVMFMSNPPYATAIICTVAPLKLDFVAIVTIMGGTIGGYITFSGGHRLLDAGISGPENLVSVTKTSLSGILVASVIRILLFLAILGVVSAGHRLNPANPTASAFQYAAGTFGLRIFGLVLFAASITSVIGAAYTSVSFLEIFHKSIAKNRNKCIVGFICFSTIVFTLIGKPVLLLLLAGAFNGLILPLVLGATLLAVFKKKIVGKYKHPLWMTILGWGVFALVTYMGIKTLIIETSHLLLNI